MNNLDTGDIILFKGEFWYSKLIEYFGRSQYSHVGFVLRDPPFLDTKGLYLLHSSNEAFPDFEDKTTKFGVRIDKLEDIIKYDGKNCKIYSRHINFERTEEFYKNLTDIHSQIHNKPYDIKLQDWIIAKLLVDGFEIKSLEKWCGGQRTNTFWCSALVCYLYFRLGLLHNKFVDWTYICPGEFSKDGNKLLHFRYSFENEIPLI